MQSIYTFLSLGCYLLAFISGISGAHNFNSAKRFNNKVFVYFGITALLLVVPEFFTSGNSSVWGSSQGSEYSSGKSEGYSSTGRNIGNIASNVTGSGFLSSSSEQLSDQAPASGKAMLSASPSAERSTPVAKKFIAVSHQLTIDASHDQLPALYADAFELCMKLNCEVINSSVNGPTRYSSENDAQLHARLIPSTMDQFIKALEKNGGFISHSINGEDKTNQVIDTEANIANMTVMRDNLRALLTSRHGNISEILEVERELARVQASIDSTKGIREVLEKQTSLIDVTVSFREKAPEIQHMEKGLSGLPSVLKNSVKLLVSVLFSLLSATVFLLPWAILGLVFFGLFKFSKRTVEKKSPGLFKVQENAAAPQPGFPVLDETQPVNEDKQA